MSDDVQLTYKRVGETYEGQIENFKFFGWTYARMMTEAHRYLTDKPEAGLVMQRTDRVGLLPARLEAPLLKLLREDPAGFIRANTLAPRVIDLTDGKKTSKLADAEKQDIPKVAGLRHGHNALAEAFGERVYIRMKLRGSMGALYEHPGTGRWADLATVEHWLGRPQSTEVFAMDDKQGWMTLLVTDLLLVKASRYFLPREWNEHGNWISKEQLLMKLDKFNKEKSNVTRK